uniref:Uncharacterized protein n=1 Tax=Globodera rostochiensis TaxID=31243 RepID=A0A914HQS0_GLORO
MRSSHLPPVPIIPSLPPWGISAKRSKESAETAFSILKRPPFHALSKKFSSDAFRVPCLDAKCKRNCRNGHYRNLMEPMLIGGTTVKFEKDLMHLTKVSASTCVSIFY